jgi:predicted amidohydrolase
MVSVNVRLAQLAPRPRDVPANLARATELIASSTSSDLVVLPELFLSGYELADTEPVAIELDAAEIGELRDVARSAGTAAVVGAAERTASGVANSAICIDSRGEVAAVYRKTHPFGAERDVYVAGDELVTVALGGRVLGLMICFDMEFPEVARTLARGGADLLVTISANPAQFELDHEVFARARALESGLPHVYVNRVGAQDGLSFGGRSVALDQTAQVLAEAGSKEERIVDAEIGAPGGRDPRTRYLDLLREELYGGVGRRGATAHPRPAGSPSRAG